MSAWSLHLLGTGSASSAATSLLGCSSAVIERDGRPMLLIDCGHDTLARYEEAYGEPPAALFLTHLHMDHVGGVEGLFYREWFDNDWRGRTRIFVHANLVPLLQGRVADYPSVLAEGGVNFWDAFRLVPCSRGFWLDGYWFDVFATRHHRPDTAFGLALRGALVWTGDTRPIPETLAAVAAWGEPIAHECALIGNPSHTGVDDLDREYDEALRRRLMLYHYASPADGEALAARGYRVLSPGERIVLPTPQPVRVDAG